jgi:4-alpha-glucanotransferase
LKLLQQLETPGTRVLQFAFDGHSGNPHLPSNYDSNSVVYTSTLDQPAARSWYTALGAKERQHMWRAARKSNGEPAETAPALMKLAWSSSAALAMAPVQDLLNLTADARMGTPAGDWRWRLTPDMLRSPAFDWLLQLTKAAKRSGTAIKTQPRETA